MFLSESDYRVENGMALEATVFVRTRFAQDVTLRLRPMTVPQYNALPEEERLCGETVERLLQESDPAESEGLQFICYTQFSLFSGHVSTL